MAPLLVGIAALLAPLADAAPSSRELSVMSYNVHALPWPFATGRGEALREIGARLAQMRANRNEPNVVLLQEAFTPEAKAIGRAAGYAFILVGPSRTERLTQPEDAAAREYSRGDDMLKGEGDGTIEDSGLMILSDYPVLAVKEAPYPRFACAGYDCLANKGILMVRVAVPGAAQPVTIFDTHMNSRRASGVGSRRSDTAFAWQSEYLRKFVRENAPDGAPAILAGDLNVGRRSYRQAVLSGGGGILAGSTDALRAAVVEQLPKSADANAIVERAKDWMLARSGVATTLTIKGYSVPFGREINGKSLSDHFGYVIRFGVRG